MDALRAQQMQDTGALQHDEAQLAELRQQAEEVGLQPLCFHGASRVECIMPACHAGTAEAAVELLPN